MNGGGIIVSVLFALLASATPIQSGNVPPPTPAPLPSAVSTTDESAVPIVITPTNVELTEAGKFDFDAALLSTIRLPSNSAVDPSFRVKVWFGPSGGSPIDCEPIVPSPTALSKTVCERIVQSARFAFHPGFAQPLERGFVMLYVFRSRRVRSTPRLDADVTPAYSRVDLHYPPDTTPESARLGATDGTFEVSLTTEDYPVTALRADLQGPSTVLLGIASDGRIATCRPIRSSATAVLDNAACTVFVRRGHYRFAAPAPSPGLRYRTQVMNWRIPN